MTKYLQSRPGSIEEITKQLMDDYQAFFKSELEKADKSIPSMTDSEKKAFFDKVAKDYNNQKEEVKPGSFKDKIMKKIGQPIKDYNKKKEDVEKAPQGHEMRSGKLLLEPKKDDLKKQPKMQQEATSQDVSVELENKNNTMLVVNPKNKKPGIDGVKKIKKSEWPEHQKQGYIQAEDTEADKENEKLRVFSGERKPVKLKTEDAIADKENESQKKKGGEKDFVKKAVEGRSDIINEDEKKKVDVKKDKKGEKDVNVQIEVEAVDPERIQKLTQHIQDLNKKTNELDKSKSDYKTKSAILQSDTTTAKLKLADLTKKKASEVQNPNDRVKTEAVKPNYKSMKKSLKSEKTMTGKIAEKIDTEPTLNKKE